MTVSRTGKSQSCIIFLLALSLIEVIVCFLSLPFCIKIINGKIFIVFPLVVLLLHCIFWQKRKKNSHHSTRTHKTYSSPDENMNWQRFYGIAPSDQTKVSLIFLSIIIYQCYDNGSIWDVNVSVMCLTNDTFLLDTFHIWQNANFF